MPSNLVPFAVNSVPLTTIEASNPNRRWLKREDLDGFRRDSFVLLENREPATFCFYMFRVKTTGL